MPREPYPLYRHFDPWDQRAYPPASQVRGNQQQIGHKPGSLPYPWPAPTRKLSAPVAGQVLKGKAALSSWRSGLFLRHLELHHRRVSRARRRRQRTRQTTMSLSHRRARKWPRQRPATTLSRAVVRFSRDTGHILHRQKQDRSALTANALTARQRRTPPTLRQVLSSRDSYRRHGRTPRATGQVSFQQSRARPTWVRSRRPGSTNANREGLPCTVLSVHSRFVL